MKFRVNINYEEIIEADSEEETEFLFNEKLDNTFIKVNVQEFEDGRRRLELNRVQRRILLNALNSLVENEEDVTSYANCWTKLMSDDLKENGKMKKWK